ncbi:MAG: ABC transporter permease [Acidobacteriota bacterium]
MITPPRLARQILRILLTPTWRPDVLAELDAEFRQRSLSEGADKQRHVRRWYWSQVLRSVPSAAAGRLRRLNPDSIWQDLRFAARRQIRNPTFAIVAVLTLALGTGANTAIFQLVNAIRMRPLPVERPAELVSIGINTRDEGRFGRFTSRRPFFTEPLYQAIREQQTGFTDVLAWSAATWNTATDGEFRPVRGLYVSGTFFGGLDVRALAGRVISEVDDRRGCDAPGAVLAYGFWQTQFGGEPSAVGQRISLDGHSFEVIGVAPPQFFGVEVGRTFDVALPLCAEKIVRGTQSALGHADSWWLDMMARLKPGWTAERAQAQLEAISPGIFGSTVAAEFNAEIARSYTAFTLTTRPAVQGVSSLRNEYGTQLWVLLGTTGLVLLITCANLANLMLARATAREREIAVRLAIGASRKRIVRQMLSESLLIAALGAAGGAIIAAWFSRTLVSFLSTDAARLFLDLTPDWRVFAFISAIAILACLLFGLSPALKATGTDPGRAMQSGSRSSTDSAERFAVRRALVVLQVALSMVLVVGAILFARSLRNLVILDPGFQQDGILTMRVDLRRASVTTETQPAMYRDVMDRVRTVPGVTAAAETYIVPLSGAVWNQFVVIDGEKKQGIVNLNRVGPDFFKAMQTPLVSGRTFTPDDRPGAADVAIVNDTFVHRYFAGQNPIGRTFQLDDRSQRLYHIVGVVKDTKYTDLKEEFAAIGYFAMAQDTEPSVSFCGLVVRSPMTPGSLTPVLTRAIREVVPGATIAYGTIGTLVRDSLAIERTMASLAGFFGMLAMLIATIGLYGVMSYMVSRRRTEFGIRMALGAEPGSLIRMVLGESSALVGAGVVIGAALALVASRWAASLLFGLRPGDPASVVLAIAALVSVSLLAAWIPARRAARVAPTLALRGD